MTAIISIDYTELEDMPDDRPKVNPWVRTPPNLQMSGKLRQVLQHDFASVLAAHVLATVKDSTIEDPVLYQPSYPGEGRSKLKDLEHNGVLYREFQGRIYTRRVG